MSRSGVGIGDDCVSLFTRLKSRSLKYIIYKLSDDKKTIISEKTSDDDKLGADNSEEEIYEKFLECLPENDCRYAVYDLEYETVSGEGKRSKICFFTWSPDTAPVKAKMVYASSKDALRRSLSGIHTEIQGTDQSEVALETILEKASKGR